MKKQFKINIEGNVISRIQEIANELNQTQSEVAEGILGKYCNAYAQDIHASISPPIEEDFQDAPWIREVKKIMNMNRS